MNETKTLNGLIKVKKYYGPSIIDALFAWFFYGLFRMAFYRFLFPWSFFGIALNYILLFSAISLTFRVVFSPRRYIYSVQTELEPEKPSETHNTPFESPNITLEEPINNKKEDIEKQEITTTTSKANSEVELKYHPSIQSGQLQYCSFCGVENMSHANFCHACGEKLR